MITSSRQKLRATLLLVGLSFILSQFLFLILPNVFEPWDAKAIDQLFLLRSKIDRLRPVYDDTVVQLDLNNSSIQQLRNFYLNRSYYAQVIRNLRAMGVSLQAYDFIFAAPSNKKDDQSIIDATAGAGNVYYGVAFAFANGAAATGKQPKAEEIGRYIDATKWKLGVDGDPSSISAGSDPLITFPALAGHAKGTGFISVKPDRDGVFRRAPLLVRYKDGFYPSFPFRITCDYLGVTSDRITVEPGRSITLKGARMPGRAPHDITIPIDRYGNMIVNFIGPWERMKHYNFAEVYEASKDRDEMELWHDELSGKIVMVSDVSTGSTDTGAVPTDVNFPLSGLHSNVIHTILTEQFLRQFSQMQMLVVDLLLLAVILFMSHRLSSFHFTVGSTLTAAGYIGVVTAAFLYGRIILQLVQPLFMVALSTAATLAYRYINEEKEKQFFRKTFEAYFPPSVVKKIMANPKLVSQKKELTILFSDIKSFTTHSAALSPDQIQRCLSEYFDAMVEIVFQYEGTVDKYIGDGLMVFFGDPEPQPDHALRCVQAAIAMQRKVSELKEKWEQDGGIPIRIRIGINTGEVVVGNMGSARRISYTVLGSAVNLAQRLESNAPVDGIMISQRTFDLIKDRIPARSLGEITVKGLSEPVAVYEVLIDQPASQVNTAASLVQ